MNNETKETELSSEEEEPPSLNISDGNKQYSSIAMAGVQEKDNLLLEEIEKIPPENEISFKKAGRTTKLNNQDLWKKEIRKFLKNTKDLSNAFLVTEPEKIQLHEVINKYHMRIPEYYQSLIQEKTGSFDPVRMQCVPSAQELEDNQDMLIDPLNEEGASPVRCLVHRYSDRALLIVTGRCYMYCRHCTRKRLWSEKVPEPTLKELEKAVLYIKENRSLREVIVSGGDPLVLGTEKLGRILKSLASIEHLQAIRIGTRTPVVFPQRIDDKLCSVLKEIPNLWINLQFNHPREITPESTEACRKLRLCGVPLSNQSVLLKGINDTPEVMKELCNKLQQIGVRPYYLFQCDPVIGTSHFRTSVWKGVELIEKLRGHTSGMCIPIFVVDGIGGKGKIPMSPNYVRSVLPGVVKLRNYMNEDFLYDFPQDEVDKKYLTHNVAVVFNLKKKNSTDDSDEEYDEIETIGAITAEIEKLGFNVIPIEQSYDLVSALRSQRIDFVLNIAEGIGTGRNRESQVPAILESLGIPYSGSDPLTLGITLDKFLTNQLLKSAGVPVPVQYVVGSEAEIMKLTGLFDNNEKFIVKPRWEGSSKGVFLNSVVDNFDDLKERAVMLLNKYVQPVVIEEYLTKEEITAGVCGNADSKRVLGMMKIGLKKKSESGFIYSIENKRDWKEKVLYENQDTIDPAVRKLVEEYALKAFSALEMKDIARIDFRVDNNTIPKIIDINPLPGLSPHYSDLPILYSLNGGTYSELVKIILEESFKRHGMPWKK